MECRYCKSNASDIFVDLGMSPLSNAYVTTGTEMERFFPLHAYVCAACLLVQLPVYEKPADIFDEYSYFSSYSASWLQHVRQYTDMIVERQGLGKDSFVVEIASNDGYLLQYFADKKIPALGIEPAKNVAEAAQRKGIETCCAFFSQALAHEMKEKKADLIIANNVLAHVPDINDFVAGIQQLLKPEGIATLEFPSVMNLIRDNQFDTIYHEHFSYLSLTVVTKIFRSAGLDVYDAEVLPTHGGSLRVYACHAGAKAINTAVESVLSDEAAFGMDNLNIYLNFAQKVKETKRQLLNTLIELKNAGKTIVGYGAAAKGNTLLNYCGIRNDFLDYVVDKNPHKQGKELPGTRLAIHAPEQISKTKPDYIFILPWNLKQEIMAQLSYIRAWGGQFIVPIPQAAILP